VFRLSLPLTETAPTNGQSHRFSRFFAFPEMAGGFMPAAPELPPNFVK
jgi:hypothetical protein